MNSANGKQHRLRRNLLGTIALAAGAAMAFGPVRQAAACWFDPIIFDPEAMVEHVDQVAPLISDGKSELSWSAGLVLPYRLAVNLAWMPATTPVTLGATLVSK